MDTKQKDYQNIFYAPKLNLDGDPASFSKEVAELKLGLNLNMEGYNGQGYWVTNMPSNELCYKYPSGYKLAGQIKLDRDQFLLCFETEDSAEIGLLDSDCKYTPWANSPCLGFKEDNWTSGVWKYSDVCTSRLVYIHNGVDPDRILEIDKPAPIIEETGLLNCDALLANSKIKYPCISFEITDGNLMNGKYKIYFALSDGFHQTSEFTSSREIALGNNHQNGLEISIGTLDVVDHYMIVLATQTEVGSNLFVVGHYDKDVKTVFIDSTQNKVPISLEEVLAVNSKPKSSKHITVVNNQLIKGGLISHAQINYQKQANNIDAKWVVRRVPADRAYLYPQFLRDELVVPYVQWIRTDGSVTEAFPLINKRDSNPEVIYNSDIYEAINNKTGFNSTIENTGKPDLRNIGDTFGTTDISGEDNVNQVYYQDNSSTLIPFQDRDNTYFSSQEIIEDDSFTSQDDLVFKNVYNSAKITKQYGNIEGIIMEGEFGIFESSETYPTDEYEYDNVKYKRFDKYAGQNIKLFRFPGNELTNHFDVINGKEYVNLLGMEFSNIEHPVDDHGVYIDDIIGYRILVADRAGNETVISKGIISNMLYDPKENSYFKNFPHNDLTPNKFISKTKPRNPIDSDEVDFTPYTEYSKNRFTYLSPETSYKVPRRGSELVVYNELINKVELKVSETYKHPKFRILTDFSYLLASVNGVAIGILGFFGSNCTSTTSGTSNGGSVQESSSTNCTAPSSVVGKIVNIVLKVLTAPVTGIIHVMQGVDSALTAIRAFSKPRQYGYQIDSLSSPLAYSTGNALVGNKRRRITEFGFIQRNKEIVGKTKINNLNRNATAYIELSTDLLDPENTDNSRALPSEFGCGTDTTRQSSNYYVAVKRKLRAPYGRLTGLKLNSISCWIYPTKDKVYKTGLLLGGDTYITKFSAKNHFPLFQALNVPENDGFEIDYGKYSNVGFARFWANSRNMDIGDIVNFATKPKDSAISNLDCLARLPVKEALDIKVTKDEVKVNVDLRNAFLKEGKFYTSVNGVDYFFVESSYINDFRIKSDRVDELHYPFQDYPDINRSDRNIYDNHFIYNDSFRLPMVAQQAPIQTSYEVNKCNKDDFKYIYSNPAEISSKVDNWRLFKPLSFSQLDKSFGSLTSIVSFDNLRLMIFFEDAVFITNADETILTKDGNSVFLGTGDLFKRRMQRLSTENTGYTGTVDKYSIGHSRYGVSWLDRKRKSIFIYSKELKDIAQEKLSKWLQEHLTDEAPTTYKENVRSVYDNHYNLIYFTNPGRAGDACYAGDCPEGYTLTSEGCVGEPTIIQQQYCDEGGVLVDGMCVKEEVEELGYTDYPVVPKDYITWGVNGLAYLSSYNVDGIGNWSLTTSAYWKGKINDIALWSPTPVVNQWVGFEECFEITETKTYYIGIAADNLYRLKLNDQIVLDLYGTPSTPHLKADAFSAQFAPTINVTGNFNTGFESAFSSMYQLFSVFPVTLTPGTHKLSMEALDTGNPGMFATEIYDNTPTEIINAVSDGDLNILFTTKGKTSFRSYEQACPVDTEPYQSSICGPSTCLKKVSYTPSTRDIIKRKIIKPTNKETSCCEWTLSYKPGYGWNSFHSFVPESFFTLSNDFHSSDSSGIWRHNIKGSYQIYYNKRFPYKLTFISNFGTPHVIQSLLIKNEVVEESNYLGGVFSTKEFFNKFTILTEYSNSGRLSLDILHPGNRFRAVRSLPDHASVSYVEDNMWRIQEFTNKATSAEHVGLNCSGNDLVLKNIDYNINPREAGLIRGTWAMITLENDKIFNKRFKTYFSLLTVDRQIQ